MRFLRQHLCEVFVLSLALWICEGSAVQRTPLRRVTSEELNADYQNVDGPPQAPIQEEQGQPPEMHVRKTVVAGRTFRTNEDSRAKDTRLNKGHNKGQQKSGFYNSYRRDESGTNSSYFEDTVDDGAEKLQQKGVTRTGQGEDNAFRDENTAVSYGRQPRRFDDNHRRNNNLRPPAGDYYNPDEEFVERPLQSPARINHNDRDGHFDDRRGYDRTRRPGVDPRFGTYERGYDQRVPADAGRYRDRIPPGPSTITVLDDPRPVRIQNSVDSGYYPANRQDRPDPRYDEYRPKPQLRILSPKRYNDYADDYPQHLESEPGRYRY